MEGKIIYKTQRSCVLMEHGQSLWWADHKEKINIPNVSNRPSDRASSLFLSNEKTDKKRNFPHTFSNAVMNKKKKKRTELSEQVNSLVLTPFCRSPKFLSQN